MADAIIDMVGPEDLPVISQLYNQIFRPPRDVESFIRRYRGRYNVLQLIARLDNRPVGFFLGRAERVVPAHRPAGHLPSTPNHTRQKAPSRAQ